MKVKIIHRTYPSGTPQVILDLEAKLRAGAEFVPGIVRRVANRYQDLLLQNVLFKGKLQDLTVVIHPSDEDAHANHTGGDCTTALKGERLCPEIHLYVNIADSAKFIAFVFAHELTHMLLNTQLDRCRISGNSKEGCRPGMSSVIRYLPTEPDVYGMGNGRVHSRYPCDVCGLPLPIFRRSRYLSPVHRPMEIQAEFCASAGGSLRRPSGGMQIHR